MLTGRRRGSNFWVECFVFLGTEPVSATVATLHDVGWKPISPGHWRTSDHEAEAVSSDKPYEATEIAAAVAEAYDRKAWRDSAQHHLGQGLERCIPSMSAAKQARAKLIKDSKFHEASCLDAVVCGGCWHDGRGSQSQNNETKTQCGRKVER